MNSEVNNNEKKPMNKMVIIFGLIIVVLIGVVVYLVTRGKPDSEPTVTPTPTPDTSKENLIEDVSIVGHECINSKCNVSIGEVEAPDDYSLNIQNSKFFLILSNYDEYIKVDIYFEEKDGKKAIVDYKLYIRSSNEDISSVTTEDELRKKVGLFPLGKYEESMTLTEIGTMGIGFDDDVEYSFINYVFTDSKENKYEMKYKNPDEKMKLVEGNIYTVNFEVVEGIAEYEYNIISIK